MPRLLIVDHKRDRVTISKQCLETFQYNSDEFLRRFITSLPETKEQSKQWTSPDESAPQKAKTMKSAGKVIATVFWNARGIIRIDYLPSKQTINGDYYTALLNRFNNILQKKCPHLANKEVLFHQDNARVHTCLGHRWPNSTNSATNCFPIQHISARFSPLRPFPVSKPRNSSEERHAPP